MVAPTAPGATDSYWPSDWYPRANLGCFDESDSAKISCWKAADLAKSRGIEVFVLGYPSYGQIDNETINGMVSRDVIILCPIQTTCAIISTLFMERSGRSRVNIITSVDFQNINVTGISTRVMRYMIISIIRMFRQGLGGRMEKQMLLTRLRTGLPIIN